LWREEPALEAPKASSGLVRGGPGKGAAFVGGGRGGPGSSKRGAPGRGAFPQPQKSLFERGAGHFPRLGPRGGSPHHPGPLARGPPLRKGAVGTGRRGWGGGPKGGARDGGGAGKGGGLVPGAFPWVEVFFFSGGSRFFVSPVKFVGRFGFFFRGSAGFWGGGGGAERVFPADRLPAEGGGQTKLGYLFGARSGPKTTPKGSFSAWVPLGARPEGLVNLRGGLAPPPGGGGWGGGKTGGGGGGGGQGGC